MSQRPTALQRRFHSTVMDGGCCVCGAPGVFHHVKMPPGLPARNHWWGACLCSDHHTQYHDAVGSVEAFEMVYDVNLDREATRNYWMYHGE